ncbi:MAG: UvrD-helicase domain-containing protein [Bacteroidia bacterium]|nr:UvrD-helicase domain-containing protein [Bacteroidia bacterium]
MEQFKIYKSSAGSGKTFTLVKEYLAIALRNPERYKNILALTFTNKAAGEMKARILSELASLSKGDESAMKEVLVAEFGIQASHIAVAAKTVLGKILHDYANFAVRTIDSFTHKLIRSFAKDLELPGRFEIEMDSKLMLQRTVDQLMDTIGRDDYVTEILVRFVEEKLRDQDGWRIESDLKNVGMELFRETSKPFLSQLKHFDNAQFPEFIEMLRQKKRAFPDEVHALAKEALEIVERNGLEARDFHQSSNSVVTKLGKMIAATKPSEFEPELGSKVFLEAAVDDRWERKGDQNPRVAAALDSGLRAKVQQLHHYHTSQFQDYNTAWHAFQNVHSLAVMQQIEDLIEAYKAQYNLVHISDFQPKIEQFIRDETPDYIYWRLGERYRHFMLDEFQDTSLLQWLNLFPLVENLKGGGAGESGSLLIVGDSKQAIYRWRGGETTLMEFLVPEKLGVVPKLLARNFRSKEYVVDFNNRFFAEAVNLVSATHPEIGQIYSDHAQLVRPGNETQGFVRIELLETEHNKFAEAAYERTVELVQSLLEQGYEYRDIAILVRTKDEGSNVAEALSKEGIRVISAESILLCKSPVVNFLVSLFRLLFDPSDAIPRAEVLHYFFRDLHHGTEWGIDPNLRIREILLDEHPIQAMFEVLPKAFKLLSYRTDRLSLYELAEETIRIFELEKMAPAFVQHFLDVVLEFSERKKPDIGAFLEFWDDKKDDFSLIVPEGENAVEILTIHKSKGLEFPIVIIPRADWSTSPKAYSTIWASSGDSFGEYPANHLIKAQAGLQQSAFGETYQSELDKTLLDNLNVLYVAFTRARERLYVLAPAKSANAQKTKGPEEIKSIGALIRSVLDTPDFRGMDANIYESGFPVPPAAKPPIAEPKKPARLISTAWRDRIRIDRKARKFWEAGADGTQSLGPLMAEVLRNLPNSTALTLSLDRLLETGMATEATKSELEKRLGSILQQPQIAAWYAEGQSYRFGMKFLFGPTEPLSVDRVIISENRFILLVIVDTTREKADLKAIASCKKFLIEEENREVDAWTLQLPDGVLAQV